MQDSTMTTMCQQCLGNQRKCNQIQWL